MTQCLLHQYLQPTPQLQLQRLQLTLAPLHHHWHLFTSLLRIFLPSWSLSTILRLHLSPSLLHKLPWLSGWLAPKCPCSEFKYPCSDYSHPCSDSATIGLATYPSYSSSSSHRISSYTTCSSNSYPSSPYSFSRSTSCSSFRSSSETREG